MPDLYDVLRLVVTHTKAPLVDVLAPRVQHGPATHTRHLVWYLANTVLGMRQAEIGRAFGLDRRTIRYGIARVEDARDAAEFNALVEEMESKLNRPPACADGR